MKIHFFTILLLLAFIFIIANTSYSHELIVRQDNNQNYQSQDTSPQYVALNFTAAGNLNPIVSYNLPTYLELYSRITYSDSLSNGITGVKSKNKSTYIHHDDEAKTYESISNLTLRHQYISMSALPQEKALGHPPTDLLPLLSSHQDKLQLALRQREVQRVEQASLRLDGVEHRLELQFYPLIANGVNGAVIRLDDVTERERLREMMVQSEKMASVGGLAAGMAHEINNPLSSILQAAQVCLMQCDPAIEANRKAAEACGCPMEALRCYIEQRRVVKFLEGIRDAGKRAAQIVSSMLEFSRKSESRRAPADLNEILEHSLALAATDYDLKKRYDFRHIEITRDYATDLPEVLCTRTEVEQVLLNLFKNAAQAMAHEINNPLSSILQAAQVCLMQLDPALPANQEGAVACDCTIEAVRCYLEKRRVFKFLTGIQEAGKRAATIVSSMDRIFALYGDTAGPSSPPIPSTSLICTNSSSLPKPEAPVIWGICFRQRSRSSLAVILSKGFFRSSCNPSLIFASTRI